MTPASTSLLDRDAATLRDLLARGEVSVAQVAEAHLARVSARDEAVRAWAWLDPEQVRREAAALDRAAQRGPLHGLPIGVKDVYDTRDMPTGQGSPLYAGHRPTRDAACIDTLRRAGALIMGKTATVEFAAMGHKPPTRNPRDPDHSPGGTSSGSAAAVADRQVPLALGTQTAGSTIRPASFCGVHAFKPTWNLVSREGVKMFSVSIDTVTWFGRSCADLEMLFDVFDVYRTARAEPRLPGQMRIAVCRTPWWNLASAAVRTAFDNAIVALGRQGMQCTDLELPADFADLAQAHIDIIMGEGRAAMLNEWRAHGDALHADIRKAFYSGEPFAVERMRSGADRAAQARVAFDRLAAPFDVVLTPSATDVAPLGLENTGSPAFNQLWSLLQTPCVNLPLPVAGLPIGITATGPRYSDRTVLAAARAIEPLLGSARTNEPTRENSHG